MRSLYSKLAVVFFVLLCITGFGYIGISAKLFTMYQQELIQRIHQNLAENIVSIKQLLHEGKVDQKKLESVFDALSSVNPSIDLYLLDLNGQIVGHNGPEGKIQLDSVDTRPIELMLKQKATPTLLGDDPKEPNKPKLFSVAPLIEDGLCTCYLYVILGGQKFQMLSMQLRDSYVVRVGLAVILLKIFLVIIAGLLLFKLLTVRLRNLDKLMNRFHESSTLDNIPSKENTRLQSSDEIDRLETTFVEMSSQINRQVSKLQKSDQNRRELVASISHDLRTPLAALQGYIETLSLKNDQLSPEQRQEYLDIAASHCENLGKLINDLFELSRLEGDDIKINKEPFNLGELIQDVLMNHKLRVEEQKLTTELEIEPELPFAFGDIAMIERVFENLLDNAFRYTQQDGTIKISLTNEANGINVQVKDSGIGIPSEELPFVFDRFYRVDKSRGERRSHAGLGLAIAKKIIEFHSTEIGIKSEVGVGTTVFFTLPVLGSKTDQIY